MSGEVCPVGPLKLFFSWEKMCECTSILFIIIINLSIMPLLDILHKATRMIIQALSHQ